VKRFSILAALLVAVLAVAAAGCGGGDGDGGDQAGGAGEQETPRVAVLFPGLVDDNSWNEAGFTGLTKAKDEGIETSYLENVSHEKQLEAFQNFARKDFNVVIGHGGEYMASAMRAARDFPDVHFVVVNGNESASNVTSIALNYADMGYISGVLGAHMSKSKKLGIVAGEHIPIVDDGIGGMKAGAASVGNGTTVRSTIIDSWTDVAKAREASLALVNAGVDALWPFLDAAETGVISAAEDEGVMSIAVYHDIRKLAPKTYVGGAWSDPGAVILQAATNGDALDGSVKFVGARENAVVLAPFADNVPANVRKEVEAAYDALKSGEVDSLEEAKKAASN
jgi:basic membrane protein A and related proteins